MTAIAAITSRHPALWRACDAASNEQATLSTGHAGLDAELPGGGWPCGEMTELLTDCSGQGELSLLIPLLAHASRHEGWLAWIAPPHLPGMSALAAATACTSRLLVVHADTNGERIWSLRQALRSSACSLVIGWLGHADTASLRRLQLAVREAAIPLILFRAGHAAQLASPAVLRLQLSASAPGALRIDILKRRGRPASRPLHLSLATPVRDTGDTHGHPAAPGPLTLVA
jgi:protein ImuA